MKRRNVVVLILLVLPLLSFISVQGSKITGSHSNLGCNSCHIDVHKPRIDVTVCSTCHESTWDMIQSGPHAGGSAPFEEYCVTCHDPHHTEYLWNLDKQEWISINSTGAELTALCYQCHAFSPEDADWLPEPHETSEATVTPFPPTAILSLILIVASATTLITTVTIMKLRAKKIEAPQ